MIPSRRKNTRVAILAFIAATSAPFAVGGGMELSFELIGQWGGSCSAVTVADDTAYLALGPRVVTLDVSDRANPAFLGQSPVLPHTVKAVEVQGDYAYVAGRSEDNGGVYVLDVSDPAQITWRGSYRADAEYCDLAVSGDWAYVVNGDSELHVYDISDPSAPVPVDRSETSMNARDVVLVGCHAYVRTWSTIDVFDVSEPRHAILVNSWQGSYWGGIAYDGAWLYGVDALADRLDVLDISEPDEPVLIGSTGLERAMNGVAVTGGYAYVGYYYAVEVVDVRDPYDPCWVGSVLLDPMVNNLFADTGTVYVANLWSGMAILDTADPSAPEQIATYGVATHANRVTATADHAFLTGYRDGVQVIDVSDPQSPERVSEHLRGDRGVAIGERFAYVANCNIDESLDVVDLADPTEPTTVGIAELPERAMDVTVVGDCAYVAIHTAGVAVVDVSDPNMPRVRGVCETEMATQIAVAYPYAYVADWEDRLVVVDVSEPNNPRAAETAATTNGAQCVVLGGGYAFVGGWDGVDIFDLSAPDFPKFISHHARTRRVTDLAYANGFLYVVPELVVVDVSNPYDVQVVGEFTEATAYGWDVNVVDDLVYVANDVDGLYIVRVRLTGDLDDDGDVDNADLLELLDRYGACVGDPGYSESADFDGDGCINLSDLAELLSHYGNQL